MVDDAAARDLLQRFAKTLVRQYDLDEVLTDLAGELRTILDVAGAGVMMVDDDGNLRFVSSSDATLKYLEDLQIELDEGPCLRAFRIGERVIAEDLRDDADFPVFGPRAVAAGMIAVYSFPLHYEQHSFGALNLYRGEPGRLEPEQEELGAAVADIASLYLMHGADEEQRARINEQLQGALDSRVAIEQAKGFVAATCDVSTTEAFEIVRRYARGNGRKLREVAIELVERRMPVSELTASRRGRQEVGKGQ